MRKPKKKPFKRQNIFASSISILLLIGFVGMLTSKLWLPYFLRPSLSSYTPTSDMENVFIEKFSKSATVNSGINLHVSSFYGDPSDTQAGELLSIDVYNSTDEPVAFENIGFGLRFFTPNDNLGDWKEVELLYTPAKISKLVGAHTMSYDMVNDNAYSVNYSDFKAELPNKIRLYITGSGQISNKTYVAFVDVLRK